MFRTPPPSDHQNEIVPITPKCVSCSLEATTNNTSCQVCRDVYHSTCAKISNNLENQLWTCNRCQPHTSKANADSLPGAPKESAFNNTRPPSISSKKSKASSQRRASLQLQRLEEEKSLQEKRDREYISKKYQILEDLSSDDDEIQEIDEPPIKSSARVDSWIQTLPPLTTNSQPHQIKGCSTFNMPNKHSILDTQHNLNLNRTWMGNRIINEQNPRDSVGFSKTVPNPINNAVPHGMLEDPIEKIPVASAVGIEYPRLTNNQLAARQALPKELPVFNGYPEEWPLFISSFESSTRTCGFTEDENLVRLQRSLKGRALDAVRCRLLHPRQVPHIIETLRLLFGKPETIINSLLFKIRQDPAPKAEKLESIIKYALSVENLCAVMEISELKSHISNPILLQELVERLPPQIRLNWGIYKQTLVTTDLLAFSTWLFHVGQAATEVMPFCVPNDNRVEKIVKKHDHLFLTMHAKKTCLVCEKNCSSVDQCTIFSDSSVEERWDIVRRKQLCRTCLRRHKKRCLSEKLCGENGCTYRHHRLLHKNREQADNKTPSTVDSSPVNHTANIGSDILFKIVPVIVQSGQNAIKTYAFLDDGSSVTLIEEELAKQLDVKGEYSPLHLKWTSNTVRTEQNSRKVDIIIKGLKKRAFAISGVRTVRSLALPTQSIDGEYLSKRFKHLEGLPIISYKEAQPKILIGLQHWKLGLPLKIREGNTNEPIATSTRLGWVVFGPYMHQQPEYSYHFQVCECSQDDTMTHELVKQYFAVENIGTKKMRLLSSEEEQAEKLLDTKARRIGQRFEVPLLWKYVNVRLPDSKRNAERRLLCLEKKMDREPHLRKLICELIQQYIEKGYAQKIENNELFCNDKVWYLPVFPVFNPNKPNKARIVWDAASKVGGVSLNSLLLSGPDITSPLLGILFRFRERRIGVCADIKEMFHQVRIADEDQNAQRFLWRNSTTNKIEIYKLVVMSFGATCSPYCAQYVKNRNAKDYMHEYPEAANAIIHNHYVDDFIDSFDNEEESLRVSKAVIKVHRYGGFEIRNFRSNSEVVMKELESFASDKQPHVAMADAEKVLGLWWSPKTDEFFFKFDRSNVQDELYIGTKKPTKRQVLRFLMQIFDPLGLVANVLISLKILLQNVWRSGIEWDEELKDEHFSIWKKWLRLLPTIKEVKIPRTYFDGFSLTSTSEVELHIFCDASEEAYATVAYLRTQNQGRTHCCFISSKTKVAPLRPLSIPRMELEAALLGTRLANSIIESHTITFKRHVYWTDSKTVIFWINGKTRKCKQLLATRVGEILERTNSNSWRWLPSKLNAADEATRPRSNLESFSMDRWYKGPEFLWQPEEYWPRTDFIKNSDTIEVVEQLHHSILQTIPITDITRYSRWRRLLNVVSKVYEFVEKILRDRRICNQLSFTDKAESYLFRQAQFELFSEDIIALKASKEISNSSPLYKLTPYLDSDGVLRIQGRIDACIGVAFDTKRPIVLPRYHHITYLIVDHYHRKYHHQYNEIVINEIRQRFYIPHLRVLLRRIQRQCQRCSNMKAKPVVPLMGELPPSRLKTFTRPFSYIGIDYFGPMSVAVGRRREKRWGVLITCLTVRAIHIEIAHTLSADSCILALQRFTARRGLPIHIYSDNGTNFRGASQELRSAVERIDGKKLIENVGEGKLKWTFIPPAAPHMGGSWERLVRSVKQTLAVIMPTQNPRDEILLTMMSEVENILNSRPLTYVPITGQEDEALTPNHFLLGSSSGAKPLGECCDDGSALKRNWLLTQQFGNSFWRRWIQEYLPDLTKRTKWFQNSKAIQKDDIVIMVDGNSPRNTWPRGRIIRTIPGGDGLVRSAVVQTSKGVYVRPTSKLAVLDVTGSFGCAKPEAPPNSPDLLGGTVDEPGSTGQPST